MTINNQTETRWRHDAVEYLTNSDSGLYELASFRHGPDIWELAAFSNGEDMKPFSVFDVMNHLFGLGLIVRTQQRRSRVTSVAAYAAISGTRWVAGDQRAIVSSVITHPNFLRQGFATDVVQQLLEQASTADAQALLGHEGFTARCNERSTGLFANLGFIAVGEEEGKCVMVGPLL